MKKILILILLMAVIIFIVLMSNKTNVPDNNTNIATTAPEVVPISHASMILNWGGMAVYTDPVGAEKFASKPEPDIILLTDIHGDHLDVEALKALSKEKTIIIAPVAVADMLPDSVPGTLYVMKNGQKAEEKGFSVEAVPMYNFPETSDSRHPKGRGNGYVVEKDGTRVYISGDTGGIPEMKRLQNIDMAFVAMNLPYTMGVEEAADAVLAFKPAKVYPYHFRTEGGFSDIAKFKEIVNSANSEIGVVELAWY
ncbi:MAG: MBL fold metallo-hydrolase [Minisyncoccia bacterium]